MEGILMGLVFATVVGAQLWLRYKRGPGTGFRGVLGPRSSAPDDGLIDVRAEARRLSSPELQAEVDWSSYLQEERDDGGWSGNNKVLKTGYHVRIEVRGAGIPGLLSIRRFDIEPAELLDLLELEQRATLDHCFSSGAVWLEGGKVASVCEITPNETAEMVRESLTPLLRRMVEAGRILATLGPQTLDWLVKQREQTVALATRRYYLELLAKHYPDEVQAQRAFAEVINQEAAADPEERLIAARALGADVLAGVIGELDPVGFEPPRWLDGMRQVIGHLPLEDMQQLWNRSLRVEDKSVVREALRGHQHAGSQPDATVLATLLTTTDDVEIVGLLATAMGQSGDPAHEPALLRRLDSEAGGNDESQSHLCWALGEVGTVQAVPVLRAVVERHARSDVVLRQAEQAIAKIQGRLKNVTVGAVALADQPESGSLAIAEERGTLAISDDGDAKD